MTTPLKAQRYLLRDGKFITTSIRLDPAHVYRYVCQNGSVILALLSAQFERLLLQLIHQLSIAGLILILEENKL